MSTSSKNKKKRTNPMSAKAFAEACMKNGSVWGLHGPKGWLTLTTHSEKGDDIQVIPLWSSEKAIDIEIDDTSPHVPTSIPLGSFVDVWIADLAYDQVLLGLNIGVGDKIAIVEVADIEKEFLKHLPS